MKNVKLTSIACVIALTGCQGLNIPDSCDQADSYELCDAERKAKIDKMLKSQRESSSSSSNSGSSSSSSSGSSYSY